MPPAPFPLLLLLRELHMNPAITSSSHASRIEAVGIGQDHGLGLFAHSVSRHCQRRSASWRLQLRLLPSTCLKSIDWGLAQAGQTLPEQQNLRQAAKLQSVALDMSSSPDRLAQRCHRCPGNADPESSDAEAQKSCAAHQISVGKK